MPALLLGARPDNSSLSNIQLVPGKLESQGVGAALSAGMLSSWGSVGRQHLVAISLNESRLFNSRFLKVVWG